MAGHSPAATVAAVEQRVGELGGITTMLPTEDAEWVGAELARRFGLPLLVVLAVRHGRQPLGDPAGPAGHRPARSSCFTYCYHGTVDETFVVVGPDGDGRARARATSAPPVPLDATTRVVPSGTTSRPSRRRWRTATWRRCSPSRP